MSPKTSSPSCQATTGLFAASNAHDGRRDPAGVSLTPPPDAESPPRPRRTSHGPRSEPPSPNHPSGTVPTVTTAVVVAAPSLTVYSNVSVPNSGNAPLGVYV